jgi:predicted MFS family arabinose efflux permease
MLFVQLAVQIETVTIGWQVYSVARETRSIEASAFLVGMVGLCQFLPMFFLSLLAGSTVDRTDRRRIVMIALAVEVVCVLGLLAQSRQPVPHLGVVFAIAAVFGAARAWLNPAATAITPMLVSKADMPRAISLKSLGWQGAVIVGPWLGGMLIGLHSSALAYAVSAGLYTTGLAVLIFLRANTRPQTRPGRRLAQIAEGLRYVWGNQIILGAISLDLFAVLLGGATALLPAFASDVLHVGAEGFGLLRSGPAAGAALMALWLTFRPIQRRAGVRMFWAVAGFGLATLVFAVSKSMWLSLAALAALGAADMVSVYVRQTLVQIVTPDHMRGRVSSVSGLFISGSNELGEFESGVVARLLGPVGAAIFGGIGTLIVTGTWARLVPDLRRADRLDGTEAPPHPAPDPAPQQAAAAR